MTLLKESNIDFVGELMAGVDKDEHTLDGRKGTRKITTLAKFKNSLDQLMADLTHCDLHYVRCLKPNEAAIDGM